MKRTTRWLLIVVAAAVGTAGAAVVAYNSVGASRLPVIQPAPDFELVNQAGRPIRLYGLGDKVKLLGFIYVRCHVAAQCPMTTRNFSDAQALIAKAGAADRTVFISVTFDPSADSPATLKGYGELNGADFGNWHFLTGDQAAIDKVCEAYSFIHEQSDPASEIPDIRHSLLAYLIDKENRIRRVYFANAWKPEDVVRDMQALIDER